MKPKLDYIYYRCDSGWCAFFDPTPTPPITKVNPTVTFSVYGSPENRSSVYNSIADFINKKPFLVLKKIPYTIYIYVNGTKGESKVHVKCLHYLNQFVYYL